MNGKRIPTRVATSPMSTALGIFVSDGKAQAMPSNGDTAAVVVVFDAADPSSLMNGDTVGNAMEYAVAETKADKATATTGGSSMEREPTKMRPHQRTRAAG